MLSHAPRRDLSCRPLPRSMKSLAGVLQLYRGDPGLHGTKQRQHGRAGRDNVVPVPVGTVVQRLRQEGDAAAGTEQQQQQEQDEEELPEWIRRWRRPFSGSADAADDDDLDSEAGSAGGSGAAAAGGEDADYEMLADLVAEGQEVVVAQGGAGGRGNAGMKPQAHRPAPTATEVRARRPACLLDSPRWQLECESNMRLGVAARLTSPLPVCLHLRWRRGVILLLLPAAAGAGGRGAPAPAGAEAAG